MHSHGKPDLSAPNLIQHGAPVRTPTVILQCKVPTIGEQVKSARGMASAFWHLQQLIRNLGLPDRTVQMAPGGTDVELFGRGEPRDGDGRATWRGPRNARGDVSRGSGGVRGTDDTGYSSSSSARVSGIIVQPRDGD
jgi:hypothetical protein